MRNIEESDFKNPDLFKRKRSIISNLLDSKGSLYSFNYSLNTLYHGVPATFHFIDKSFKERFEAFLPTEWKDSSIESRFDLHILTPESWDIDPESWSDEESPECYIYKVEDWEGAIQRDFAGIKNETQVFIVVRDDIEDSLFNALRWFIPRQMLKIDNLLLHSSCVIGHDEKAHFFLGHSDAGKTTITTLADDRLVLGDDMNVVITRDGNFYAEAGALGGRVNNFDKIGKSYPIAGFYWLVQSKSSKKERLSTSKAALKLTASCANLFWGEESEEETRLVMELVGKIALIYPFYQLEFSLDREFWKYVDGENKN